LQKTRYVLTGAADFVAVSLLTAMFLAFILQIFSRYVIRQPLGWTLEACLLCWLWLVFWASAFTLRHSDHVRFTILVESSRPGLRRIYAGLSAIAIVAALALALPASYEFIAFMAIEKTSLLKIRFDWVFSVYLIFSIAMIIRYGSRLICAIRGRMTE